MIFQSLGSNYNLSSAVKLLFSRGRTSDREKLIRLLEKRYGGIAFLYDKGRDALSAALHTIGSPVTAINGTTCSVVVEALSAAKSSIIYLDIESNGHFSAKTLQKSLSAHRPPKAVVIQNTYGSPCDIAAIEKLAQKHDLILIEDLAHSLGQTYADGREVGTVGDIVMLSFGRDKVIDVVNGGALIVREPTLMKNFDDPTTTGSFANQLRDRIYPLLTWFARHTYRIYLGKLIVRLMYSLRLAEHSADGGIDIDLTMPNWQAKRLIDELHNIDENIAHRKKIVKIYESQLGGLITSKNSLLRTPLLVKNRDELLAHLAQHHYYLHDTWYDVPVGPKRKYLDINYPAAHNPKSVKFSEHVVNLPTHQEVTVQSAEQLCAIVKEFYV